MPTLTLFEELLDAARKDGEHTGLLAAINAVDVLISHSSTLSEFQGKWATAKALYEETVAA